MKTNVNKKMDLVISKAKMALRNQYYEMMEAEQLKLMHGRRASLGSDGEMTYPLLRTKARTHKPQRERNPVRTRGPRPVRYEKSLIFARGVEVSSDSSPVSPLQGV